MTKTPTLADARETRQKFAKDQIERMSEQLEVAEKRARQYQESAEALKKALFVSYSAARDAGVLGYEMGNAFEAGKNRAKV